ncbi:MAG: 50S ribosomal protein L15 [Candidatus Omnitrophota bacterium]|nr:50S ribosomal protein L15 [Candidatus Omnitrophota bacterium]
MYLTEIKRPIGACKRRKIVGRGESSGHGKTSTRGSNGQRARSGRGPILGFEGGQTPLIRRIPKRGFHHSPKEEFQLVNIGSLARFDADMLIDPQLLETKGLIRSRNKPVKILGGGKVSISLVVKAHAFSKSAKDLIEKAGGKTECLKP